MYLDPNKSYYLVDAHTGKGLTYEVYSNYDYILEAQDKGTSVKFEPVEGTSEFRIRMNGYHWDNYFYLTRSGSNWIYLDKKENASKWFINGEYTHIWQSKILGSHWTYFDKGSKKWLGTSEHYESINCPTKRFKIIATD